MTNKKIDFEESLDRIIEISDTLEGEELKLDKSMELYKEAMTLINACKNQIDKAERDIYILRENPNAFSDEEEPKTNTADTTAEKIETQKKTKTKKSVKSNKTDETISFELFSDIDNQE